MTLYDICYSIWRVTIYILCMNYCSKLENKDKRWYIYLYIYYCDDELYECYEH